MESHDVAQLWMRYPVNKDGSVGAGTLFCDPSSDKTPGGPDGITDPACAVGIRKDQGSLCAV